MCLCVYNYKHMFVLGSVRFKIFQRQQHVELTKVYFEVYRHAEKDYLDRPIPCTCM